MDSMRSFALLFLICLLALVGCAKKEVTKLTAAPDPVLPERWEVHRVDAVGCSFAAPDNWVIPKEGIGMDAQTLQNLSNPSLAIGVGGKESSAATAEYILFDRNIRPIPGEPATSLMVGKQVRKGGANLKEETDKLAEEYTGEERTSITLPVGPAEQIRAAVASRGGDKYRHIDFVLVNGEDVYTFRFVSAQSMEAIKSVALPIMETFRVHKPAP